MPRFQFGLETCSHFGERQGRALFQLQGTAALVIGGVRRRSRATEVTEFGKRAENSGTPDPVRICVLAVKDEEHDVGTCLSAVAEGPREAGHARSGRGCKLP